MVPGTFGFLLLCLHAAQGIAGGGGRHRTLIRDVSNRLAGHLDFNSSLLPKLLLWHVSRDQVLLLSPFPGTSVLKYLHCWPLHRILKPSPLLVLLFSLPTTPSPTALSPLLPYFPFTSVPSSLSLPFAVSSSSSCVFNEDVLRTLDLAFFLSHLPLGKNDLFQGL